MFQIILFALLITQVLTSGSSQDDFLIFKENDNRAYDKYDVYTFGDENARMFPTNCVDALKFMQTSGIYKIQVDKFSKKPFDVACDADKDGGGWLVIQRRQDGSVDFYRYWSDYKHGFGNLNGEFWIGLDKLHALTNSSQQELLIYMEDYDGNQIYAKYDAFAIGDENEKYALTDLGEFSGDAGDSLHLHKGMKFSTQDEKNDVNGNVNCAKIFKGAWWYKACFASNLNGRYHRRATAYNVSEGILWLYHKASESLKYVQMMIRPKSV